MRVAVVTPYHREADSILKTCLASVAKQTYPMRRHFLVADGFPKAFVSKNDVAHIVLPTSHGDCGGLARCIGAMAAASEGFDAVAFLDADNWYRADHIERLVNLHKKTGAAVCTSGRTIHRLDGTLMGVDRQCDGDKFVDTSCLCIFRGAFDVLPLWGLMPPKFGPISDRIMWQAILQRGISRSHSSEPTVAFRSQYAVHYRFRGEAVPSGAKEEAVTAVPAKWFSDLPPIERASLLLGLGAEGGGSALTNQQPIKSRRIRAKTAGSGRQLTIEVPDDRGTLFVAEEVFKRECYRPVSAVAQPTSILDIGANVGISAAYFRLVYPEAALYCVEPDPAAYQFLERNAQAIGGCRTYRAGLFNATCCSNLYLGPSSVQNSLSPTPGRSIRVLLLDARKFVTELPSAAFDLVKIDTEGAEIPIILRLQDILQKTAVVHIEYHSSTDQRLINDLLGESHQLWRTEAASPHRGLLTYVLRGAAGEPEEPARHV